MNSVEMDEILYDLRQQRINDDWESSREQWLIEAREEIADEIEPDGPLYAEYIERVNDWMAESNWIDLYATDKVKAMEALDHYMARVEEDYAQERADMLFRRHRGLE